MSGFVVSIPVPPSLNGIYANRNPSMRGRRAYGRVKTRKYKAWIALAGREVLGQRRGMKPVHGRYRLFLTLPALPSNSDPDNRIKAASDLIVSMGLVDDDRHCVEVRALVDRERPKGMAIVEVRPA